MSTSAAAAASGAELTPEPAATTATKTELLAAGIAVNAAPTLEEALQRLVDEGRRLVGADGVSVAIWDVERGVGVIRAGAGMSERFVGATLSEGTNAPYRALRSGHPVVIRGEQEPTGVPAWVRDQLGGPCHRAAAAVLLGGAIQVTVQAVWLHDPGDAAIEDAIATFQALAAVTGVGHRASDEEARARREALLDGVLESVPDGIAVRTGDTITFNSAGRELLGLAADEDFSLEALHVRTLDGTPVRAGDGDPVREWSPARNRYRIRRADGEERILETAVSAIVTGDGTDVGDVVVFHDVTEGHAEQARTASLVERLFAELPTAIVVWEPGSFRVERANRAFHDLVGYGPDEVAGATPPYPWWAEESAAPTAGWLADDTPLEWEHLYRHRDGHLVPTRGTAFVLRDEQGAPERVVGLIHDLSERRRFEQQLVHSGKLAAIGELAAGVAHEINNPLFAILGLVEFLLNEVEEGSKAQARLQLIQETGLEIKEIVRALLDFAREPSDEVGLVDLSEVTGKTVELVRRTTPAKGVTVVERRGEEPLPVRGSANQLKQVVLNLVTNAQHAVGDEGTVTVEVRREGRSAVAVVTDDGPGISPETFARIFDPFFTTKRSVGGTGLGLSVSLGIAQMHGGDLTVESEPGRGASFTLQLPLADGADR